MKTNVNPVSEISTYSSEVTASPCVNVPQQVRFSAREQCLVPDTIDVPVCNDLVDLSYEVYEETSKEPSVVVLNSDLEGLSYPVPKSSVHAVNSITFEIRNNCPFLQGQVSGIPTSLLCDTGAFVTTISEKLFNKFPNCKKTPSSKTFQQAIRTVSGENMPIKAVALVPFQIGEFNYTFYACIIENLAYDAILGSDFLAHYQGVINFDNQSLELLPPGEKSPPYPTFKGEVRVHNNLRSNERSYIAYLAYKVSCLQIRCKSRNIALKLLKFAYCAAAIIYIGAKPRSCSGFTS